MKLFPKSLKAQFLVGLLIFSIGPISILGYLAYQSGRQNIIFNVQAHLKTIAVLKKQAINNWADHLKISLSWIATDPETIHHIQTIIEKKDTHKTSRQLVIDEFNRLITSGYVSTIFLLDKDTGQIITSSDISWEGKFNQMDSFFIQSKKEFHVSEVFLSLSMGRPIIMISGPIFDRSGKIICLLAAHANFEKLSDIMLEHSGIGKTTETFLVSKSNLLITNTVFAPDGAFKKWIFGQGAKWAIAGQSGVDVFIDYRDVEVIGAYLWLADRKLALIAKQDASEAFAPITTLKKQIFFIGTGIFIVILFFSFLFTNKITKPLRRLIEGAHIIGEGNLDHRVKISRQDEIGRLSSAFNDMIQNLKSITISRDEKEVLLKEIHHRVKNNLQMIQSLMNLQMSQFTDKALIAPLQDSINRISSIALVHETLYRSDNLAALDLASYFRDLTNYLLKSLGPSESDITLECSIEQMPLPLDSVVACGLIINELMTNTLKYAFLDRPSGKICVILQKLNETEALLTVSDNGEGIPQPKKVQEKKSLGIDLVNILVNNQLEGTITINQRSGLEYQIQFPI